MLLLLAISMHTDATLAYSGAVSLGLFATLSLAYAAATAYMARGRKLQHQPIIHEHAKNVPKGHLHTSSEIGAAIKQCPYHEPIITGQQQYATPEISPMDRFLAEGSFQQPAIFTRADNWKLSLSKGCMCEIASDLLSISTE
jgi:hypothetical protein